MVESKELIELAREFRKNPTPAENKLWGYLKNKQLDGPIHNNPDVINNDKKREEYLKENGVEVSAINKVKEGSPHCVESIESQKINIVINTVFGEQSIKDSFTLRRSSLNQNLPYCTTMAGASALVSALRAIKEEGLTIKTIQEYGAKI